MSLKALPAPTKLEAAAARQLAQQQATSQPATKQEEPLVIESATSRGTFGDSQYRLKTNQGDFYYVPLDYVNRGYAAGQYQYYNPEFLDKDFLASGKRVNLDPTVLEGKEITSAFENPNSGYLFKADDFEKRVPTTAFYHEFGSDPKKQRIGGISEVPASGSNTPEGGLKYVLENNAENQLSFINPNATATTRTYTVEYSGIFGSRVAEALAKGAQAIGKVPFLTELTAAIPVVGPAVYGTIKGAQAGAAGKGPLEAAAETGLTLATASLVKNALAGLPPATGTEGFGAVSDEVYQGASGTVPSALGGASELASVGASGYGLTAPVGGGLLGGASELASVAETMAPTPSPANVMEYGFPMTEPITPQPADIIPGYATPENVFEYGYPQTEPITPAPANIITAPNMSIMDALRGASLARQLLTPQQQQTPNLLGQAAEAAGQMQGAVDYSSLLGLLSQRAGGTGLLGTQFQPQPINLASLLG